MPLMLLLLSMLPFCILSFWLILMVVSWLRQQEFHLLSLIENSLGQSRDWRQDTKKHVRLGIGYFGRSNSDFGKFFRVRDFCSVKRVVDVLCCVAHLRPPIRKSPPQVWIPNITNWIGIHWWTIQNKFCVINHAPTNNYHLLWSITLDSANTDTKNNERNDVPHRPNRQWCR